jgi:hypothetical protein
MKRTSRKTNLTRLACWNITSWRNRDQEIIQELESHKIDICGVSETKKKGQGITKYPNYILIYSGKEKSGRAHSGVGLLLRDIYEQYIDHIEYINHRIVKVTIILSNTKIHLISTYAPDISRPREETDEFYEHLQATIENVPTTQGIIILGDLNARLGNQKLDGLKQICNEAIFNDNGEKLIDFCARHELRINNTFFPHKEQHKYTFINSRGEKSIIDFIITNRYFKPTQIIDVRALTSANVGTDHHLVLCKLNIEKPRKIQKPPKIVSKLNIESISDDSTRILYQNRLSQYLINNPVLDSDNVDQAWIKVKSAIDKAASEALEKRNININTERNTKPWFNDDVRRLAEDKKKSYLTYRSNPSNEEYAKYVTVRNRVNSEIKKIKKEYWRRFTKDMEHDLYGAQRKVWKMLREKKKPINEYVQTNKISIAEWERYFGNLYSNTITRTETDITITESATLEENEITNGMKRLKNRKGLGYDDIPNELLKYGGEELANNLHSLFNLILEETKIPEEWRTSITVPIFKKGQKSDPCNYRGISLLNTTLKLFTNILRLKLERQIENRDEQQGFRRNRSTTDAIFMLRQVKEKSLEYNKTAYIVFIDLTKAFDRIQLEDVINVLLEKPVPPSIAKVIRNINSNSSTRIRVNGELSAEIPTPTGVRQGDSLSPFLFNLIMDKIIEEVAELNVGYRMGERLLNIECYADDATIIAESEQDLQLMLNQFHMASMRYNMSISISKTKCMTIARQQTGCNVTIDRTPVEQVTKFKYLGVSIASNSDLYGEVLEQTQKAAAISGCLREAIWKNEHMNIPSKVRIYKTCVRPIMTYGIESRADTVRTKNLLRTSEMKTLRNISGKTLRDRVRNTEIRRICEVEDVVRWGRQRRRFWNDHV